MDGDDYRKDLPRKFSLGNTQKDCMYQLIYVFLHRFVPNKKMLYGKDFYFLQTSR